MSKNKRVFRGRGKVGSMGEDMKSGSSQVAESTQGRLSGVMPITNVYFCSTNPTKNEGV